MNDCSTHARCNDTEGSFICECLNGFYDLNGDGPIFDHGKECENINECDFVHKTSRSRNRRQAPDDYDYDYGDNLNYTKNVNYTDNVDNQTVIDDYDDNYENNVNYTKNDNYTKSVNYTQNGNYTQSANYTQNVNYTDNGNNTDNVNFDYDYNNEYDDTQTDDLDEIGPEYCSPDAYCVDNIGSFTCQCKPGFRDMSDYPNNGRLCENINECNFDSVACSGQGNWCIPNNCDKWASCKDTVGSFECTCLVGYAGNGTSCVDIDECDTFSHQCDLNAKCLNRDGQYDCKCKKGFTGNGEQCDDIDECEGNIHDCDYDAYCENTEGSYECQCKSGFSGFDGKGQNTFGRACFDVDECAIGAISNSTGKQLSQCDKLARCTNYRGGYSCECIKGYYGDGKICRDFNECLTFNITQSLTGMNFTGMNSTGMNSTGMNYTVYSASVNSSMSDLQECHQDSNCINTIGMVSQHKYSFFGISKTGS